MLGMVSAIYQLMLSVPSAENRYCPKDSEKPRQEAPARVIMIPLCSLPISRSFSKKFFIFWGQFKWFPKTKRSIYLYLTGSKDRRAVQAYPYKVIPE